MTQKFNFTKSTIEKLNPAPKGKRLIYRDARMPSLMLRVTEQGTKSFSICRKIKRRPVRITIGKFPNISIENARTKAAQKITDIANGANPNEEKKKLNNEMTFGELFEEFMERYSRPYKKSWKHDEREVKKYLSCWFKRKISDIHKSEVKAIHDKICRENGLYQANRTLERIRAIYNKAIEWGVDITNPTIGIKKFKEKSRDRFLQKNEIADFFKSLNEENCLMKGFFLLLLFTGARKSNVMAMRWKDIDFENDIWKIPETKNGEPLALPLSAEAIDILFDLKAKKEENAVYVFPGKGSSGHLVEPRKVWQRILKRANIENFRIHDLRRTLGSWQAMNGASTTIIGRSLGHKSQQATAIYSRLSLDPVRSSVSQATQAMLNVANEAYLKNKTGEVLPN